MPITPLAGTLYWDRRYTTRTAVEQQAPSDETLILAVKRRDQRALAELLRRHSGWAARFAERLTASPELAEEVVQTAFMRVWDKAEQWQGKARFTTWFYRVLHNLCIDQVRLKRVGFELLDENFIDPLPTAEHVIETEQRSERVRRALMLLPERQRTAIVLSHFEECSQSEAASIMGITESALEALLVRGRTALRQHLYLEQH